MSFASPLPPDLQAFLAGLGLPGDPRSELAAASRRPTRTWRRRRRSVTRRARRDFRCSGSP